MNKLSKVVTNFGDVYIPFFNKQINRYIFYNNDGTKEVSTNLVFFDSDKKPFWALHIPGFACSNMLNKKIKRWLVNISFNKCLNLKEFLECFVIDLFPVDTKKANPKWQICPNITIYNSESDFLRTITQANMQLYRIGRLYFTISE